MNTKIFVALLAVICIQSSVAHLMMMPNLHMPNLLEWFMSMHRPSTAAPQRPTSSAPAVQSTTPKPLTGDTESSFRVVDKLCSLPDSTIGPIAQQFGGGCYEQEGIPKQYFAACQNQIFGCTWDQLECIKANCLRFHAVYDSYVNCIVGQFTAANLTIAQLFECGTKVNVCQGGLIGLP